MKKVRNGWSLNFVSIFNRALSFWHTDNVLDAAGVETTQEAMNRFVASMIEHPEIQRRAQEEIDLVIGKERLPGIEE